MRDDRPDRVYGILVRDERAFLASYGGALGLPGGMFAPMADDRKGELRVHLHDQLGISAGATWAQGAFLYRHPSEEREQFSGFYTVWAWTGDVPVAAGRWLSASDVAGCDLPPSLKILLTSVLAMQAVKTT